MKNLNIAIASIAILSSAMSCNVKTLDENVEYDVLCPISINCSVEGIVTKSGTEAYSSETAVNSVQYLIFDSEGALDAYDTAGSTDYSSKTIYAKAGMKTVWVVLNGPSLSSITTLTDLENTAIELGNYNSPSADFVMAGSNTCDLNSDGASCSVTARRFVSRVRLKLIKNELPEAYSDVSVARVFISNVIGNQNLKGKATPTIWYNQEGRKDESTRNKLHIIDGTTYKASCPELTFKSLDSSLTRGDSYTDPVCLYAYPNDSEYSPSTGFTASFVEQYTKLVIVMDINGTDFYYPLNLKKKLERNKTYDVSVTLTQKGNSDPNEEIKKNAAGITITVADWEDGQSYDETL